MFVSKLQYLLLALPLAELAVSQAETSSCSAGPSEAGKPASSVCIFSASGRPVSKEITLTIPLTGQPSPGSSSLPIPSNSGSSGIPTSTPVIPPPHTTSDSGSSSIPGGGSLPPGSSIPTQTSSSSETNPSSFVGGSSTSQPVIPPGTTSGPVIGPSTPPPGSTITTGSSSGVVVFPGSPQTSEVVSYGSITITPVFQETTFPAYTTLTTPTTTSTTDGNDNIIPLIIWPGGLGWTCILFCGGPGPGGINFPGVVPLPTSPPPDVPEDPNDPESTSTDTTTTSTTPSSTPTPMSFPLMTDGNLDVNTTPDVGGAFASVLAMLSDMSNSATEGGSSGFSTVPSSGSVPPSSTTSRPVIPSPTSTVSSTATTATPSPAPGAPSCISPEDCVDYCGEVTAVCPGDSRVCQCLTGPIDSIPPILSSSPIPTSSPQPIDTILYPPPETPTIISVIAFARH